MPGRKLTAKEREAAKAHLDVGRRKAAKRRDRGSAMLRAFEAGREQIVYAVPFPSSDVLKSCAAAGIVCVPAETLEASPQSLLSLIRGASIGLWDPTPAQKWAMEMERKLYQGAAEVTAVNRRTDTLDSLLRSLGWGGQGAAKAPVIIDISGDE